MSGHGRIDWKDSASWLIVVCIAVTSGLNMVGGYDLLGGADGGLKAKGIALGGLCLALIGPVFGLRAVPMLGDRRLRWFGGAMLAVGLACFGLSQYLGYRAVGATFADGALKRQIKGDDIAGKVAELKAIGIVRPVATIKAELDLERRRTSKTYPDGKGPAATKLEGELATADRKAKLETEIAAAGKSGGQVQAGAENMVLSRLVGTSAEQNMLIGIVLFCVLIEFVATFGFALLEVSKRGIGGGGGPGGGGRDPLDTWYEEEGRFSPAGFARFKGLTPPADRTQRVGHQLVLPPPDMPWPAAGAAQGGPASATTGVTININGSEVGRAGAADKPAAGAQAPAAAAGRDVEAAARRAETRNDLPSLQSDKPIDRSAVPDDLQPEERAAADVLLAFRAACVIDTPGGLVSIVNLYRRYEAWAGERAVAEPAFAQMFPRITGVRLADVGGFLHAHDVALRVGASLRAA